MRVERSQIPNPASAVQSESHQNSGAVRIFACLAFIEESEIRSGFMKVVLFGASGMIGSRILKELTERGHQVKAVVRDLARVPFQAEVTTESGNILNPEEVARAAAGADAAVSAYSPGNSPE